MTERSEGTGDRPVLVVVVVRTGGLAGLRREWRVEVGEQDAPSWWPLVEACPWDADLDADGVPDRFVYDVRANEREVRLPESRLEGPWSALAEAVRRRAEGQA